MMAGYHFFPKKPGRLASVLAIFAGFPCLVVSLFLLAWLLLDTGGTQGSVGAWMLILAVGSLGIVPAILLALFAGAGCFVARVRK